MEEEYNLRRTKMKQLLEDSDIHVNKLTTDLASMVETRDDVQGEYHAISKDLRSRFAELRALLEMRESMLLSDLDKLRNQKSDALRKGASDCRECIEVTHGDVELNLLVICSKLRMSAGNAIFPGWHCAPHGYGARSKCFPC